MSNSNLDEPFVTDWPENLISRADVERIRDAANYSGHELMAAACSKVLAGEDDDVDLATVVARYRSLRLEAGNYHAPWCYSAQDMWDRDDRFAAARARIAAG